MSASTNDNVKQEPVTLESSKVHESCEMMHTTGNVKMDLGEVNPTIREQAQKKEEEVEWDIDMGERNFDDYVNWLSGSKPSEADSLKPTPMVEKSDTMKDYWTAGANWSVDSKWSFNEQAEAEESRDYFRQSMDENERDN